MEVSPQSVAVVSWGLGTAGGKGRVKGVFGEGGVVRVCWERRGAVLSA